ncbi:DUF7507 domain-containing protein [Patulibacter defluvii]|uniref:DUF7507 domain-containing protein n=1 Tax=Patulibacter defluvii TaxID=3095358 RepID=UPI002A766985|nr:hypothetical protein [Patulibacter sp. DM4]
MIFDEQFENGLGATATSLANYQGEGGVRYSSNAYWVRTDQCNGALLQYQGTVFPSGYCTTGNSAQPNVRRLADVLGQVNAGVQGSASTATPVNGSTAATRTNHAVTAWTGAVDGPDDAIVFESSPLNLTVDGSRFFAASIDVAEVSCAYRGGENNSRLNFYLVSQGQQLPLNATPIRACTDPGVAYYTSPDLGGWGNGGGYVAAGHYFSNGSYLVSPEAASTLGFRMRNLIGSSQGNDFAYDNPRLVDATPQLDKSFAPTSVPTGGTSTLTFTVTNTSELAAKNGWSFTDTLPDGLVIADPANVGGSCQADVTATAGGGAVEIADGRLAAGETSCTITVDVTSDTPRGADPSPKTYENCADNITAHAGLDLPGCSTVAFHSEPALEVSKTTDGSAATRVGDTVSYEVLGENSGTADFTEQQPAVVFDDLAGVLDDADLVEGSLRATIDGQAVDPPSRHGTLLAWDGPLPAGKDVVITYDVVVKDGGDKEVANVAFPSATAYDADDPPTTPRCGEAGSSCTTFSLPAITLRKSADSDELVAGRTITYSFEVTNSGKQPLADVTVDEGEFSGSGDLSEVTCPDTALDPGESTTCTATYEVTQADVDRGSVENSATATGRPPSGDPVTSEPSRVEIPAEPAPAIGLVKSADTDTITHAGQRIIYSFVVANSGNVTLTDVTVAEGDFSGTGELSEITCPAEAGSLAPERSVTCTATYEVTQADVDRGSVENSATATGRPPSGDPVTSEPSRVEIPAEPAPAIALVKTADRSELVAGETVTYSFTVTNTGNVTLADVTVAEGDFSGTGELSEITCPAEAASVAPQESVTCTATYAVTQADVDRGSVENSATASGTPPAGDPVTSDRARARIPQDPKPGIGLVKRADRERATAAGQVITYSFVVTNTGNVTLTGVRVDEGDFNGHGRMSAVTCPDGATRLRPGQTVTCTATYVVVAEDLTGQPLVNVASAAGTPPGSGAAPVASPPARATVETATAEGPPPLAPPPPAPPPAAGTPRLRLTKVSSATVVTAGRNVRYAIKVGNRGNGPARHVVVCDELPRHVTVVARGGGRLKRGRLCFAAIASLAPGRARTYRVGVRVDRDAPRGGLVNRASVRAAGIAPVQTSRRVRIRPRPAPTTDRTVVTG